MKGFSFSRGRVIRKMTSSVAKKWLRGASIPSLFKFLTRLFNLVRLLLDQCSVKSFTVIFSDQAMFDFGK